MVNVLSPPRDQEVYVEDFPFAVLADCYFEDEDFAPRADGVLQ